MLLIDISSFELDLSFQTQFLFNVVMMNKLLSFGLGKRVD